MDMYPHNRPEEDGLLSSFHAYPWQTDLAFLKGLVALLGGVDKLRPDPSHADLALHARIFYYHKVRQAQVDFSAYKRWVADAPGPFSHTLDQDLISALYWARARIAAIPGSPPPNPVHAVAAIAQQYASRSLDGTAATSDVIPGPAWQQAAPKLELRVDRGPQEGGGNAPYPAHFAELIAAVRANKPVPGVREIPDTVVRNPDIKPVGTMAAPRKPWEFDTAGTEQSTQPLLQDDGVERRFPALDGTQSPDSEVTS